MKFLPITLLTMTLIASPITMESVHAADGWMKENKARSLIKKMNKKGMIPSSMKCRNSPDAGKRLKPEIKVAFKENKASQSWQVFAMYSQMKWMPGIAGAGWRKIYLKRFTAPASGRAYYCGLWYGPKNLGAPKKKLGTVQDFKY